MVKSQIKDSNKMHTEIAQVLTSELPLKMLHVDHQLSSGVQREADYPYTGKDGTWELRSLHPPPLQVDLDPLFASKLILIGAFLNSLQKYVLHKVEIDQAHRHEFDW
ncbi:hypothetical protein LXL04_036554 [Taraxacum kok-saghyz]